MRDKFISVSGTALRSKIKFDFPTSEQKDLPRDHHRKLSLIDRPKYL